MNNKHDSLWSTEIFMIGTIVKNKDSVSACRFCRNVSDPQINKFQHQPSFLHNLDFWQFFSIPHWVNHFDKYYQLRLGPNLSICLSQHLIKAAINRTLAVGWCQTAVLTSAMPPHLQVPDPTKWVKPHKSLGSTLGKKRFISHVLAWISIYSMVLIQIQHNVFVIAQTLPWPTKKEI